MSGDGHLAGLFRRTGEMLRPADRVRVTNHILLEVDYSLRANSEHACMYVCMYVCFYVLSHPSITVQQTTQTYVGVVDISITHDQSRPMAFTPDHSEHRTYLLHGISRERMNERTREETNVCAFSR